MVYKKEQSDSYRSGFRNIDEFPFLYYSCVRFLEFAFAKRLVNLVFMVFWRNRKILLKIAFVLIVQAEMNANSNVSEFEYLFKLLMIGDSGVGKSSLLLSFTSDDFEDLSPTIGVDFKVKYMDIGGKKLKLAIWDTAGQERFRTLTSSYYRGAQGIIMAYDVTRRDTFTNLSEIWTKEIDLYSTSPECIKMLVGNKVDKERERVVTKKEGMEFARKYGCLFIECSAKTRVNVQQCFEELVLKILDTPSLVAEGSKGLKKNIFKEKPQLPDSSSSSCC